MQPGLRAWRNGKERPFLFARSQETYLLPDGSYVDLRNILLATNQPLSEDALERDVSLALLLIAIH